MSSRELKSLQELSGTQDVVARKSLRSGLIRDPTMDQQLEARLAHLEAELSQARRSLEQKDVEMDRLRSQVEQATREADKLQREAEQRSQALEERLARETESSMLRAEVEKFRALEELRGEHQRAMERERKVMDDWMQHRYYRLRKRDWKLLT